MKKLGLILIIAGAALLVVTLGYDMYKGEGGVTLGPKSIPAIIASVIILGVGLKLTFCKCCAKAAEVPAAEPAPVQAPAEEPAQEEPVAEEAPAAKEVEEVPKTPPAE